MVDTMTHVQRISCGDVNCFLITKGQKAILVDTGRQSQREKILKACETLTIEMIVLTHGHIDHIENAKYLSDKLKAPIGLNSGDFDLIKNNLLEPMQSHTFFGRLVLWLSNRAFQTMDIEAFEPSIDLHEGYDFKSFGLDAKVIGLPGHTKGSIGIMINDSDFIVGDALMNMIRPSKTLIYGNYDKMIKSAQRISASKVETIHFGHGKSVPNRQW
jgi:glyoxylase-like metal-dependent hydrolase (beta-lactamase superfamily II)